MDERILVWILKKWKLSDKGMRVVVLELRMFFFGRVGFWKGGSRKGVGEDRGLGIED